MNTTSIKGNITKHDREHTQNITEDATVIAGAQAEWAFTISHAEPIVWSNPIVKSSTKNYN